MRRSAVAGLAIRGMLQLTVAVPMPISAAGVWMMAVRLPRDGSAPARESGNQVVSGSNALAHQPFAVALGARPGTSGVPAKLFAALPVGFA